MTPTEESFDGPEAETEAPAKSKPSDRMFIRPKATAPTIPLRELPSSPEDEAHLLAVCMMDDGLTLDAAKSAGIEARSFYDDRHGAIFGAMLDLRAAQQPVETSVIASHLRDRKQLDRVGGIAYLSQVTSSTPTTAEASFFIQRVREQSILRNLIRASDRLKEDCYNFSGGIDEFLAEQTARVSAAANGYAGPHHLKACPLTDFQILPKGDPSILLGNRYLSRGDIAILASTAGMGKSSLSIQAAVTWALARPLFGGLDPHGRPLRSLIFQAEDSDGDVAEVKHSIFHAMKLTDAEQAQVGERIKIVTDRVHRGLSFLAELKRQIALFKPDLVWINPLLAFIGGDVNDAESVGCFLREGLNSLNEPATFAYVIVHHTSKPPKEKQDRRWNEVMYDMAGSADLTNAARAIISLRPSSTEGDFNLVFAKRGRRAGFTKVVEGKGGASQFIEPTTTIGLKHSKERMAVDGQDLPVIYWEQCEVSAEAPPAPKNLGGRPSKYHFEEMRTGFPAPDAQHQTIATIFKAVTTISGISRSSFKDLVATAYQDGFLDRVEKPGIGYCFRLN